MEADEQGILTEVEIRKIRGYGRAERWSQRRIAIMLVAARAQHDHDVATVREIEVPNPYLGGGDSFSVFWQGLSDAKKACLAALKAKAENAG